MSLFTKSRPASSRKRSQSSGFRQPPAKPLSPPAAAPNPRLPCSIMCECHDLPVRMECLRQMSGGLLLFACPLPSCNHQVTVRTHN